jgi:signal transduction histidine kinase
MALQYYNKALRICENYGLTGDLARHYHNVGNVYKKTNNLRKARENYLKSLNLSIEKGQDVGIMYNNMALALVEMDEGLFTSAAQRLNKVDELIDLLGMTKLGPDLLEAYAKLEESRGNFAKALEYHKQFKAYADSMQLVANQQQIDEMQIKYESEKKSLENEKLKNQDMLNKEIIRNQRLLGLFILITLVFLILFIIIISRSRQKLKRAFGVLKKLNQEVISQKEKLEEANDTKDKMFAIIAHDLRSPFSALMGFLNLLISDFETLEDAEKKEMLEVVNNQSIKTYGLLENLLQWSMMQRGMIVPHPEELELNSIVHFQFNELRSRAANKQIELVNNVPAGLQIFIDETICNTILRNLINNAIKFTQRGGLIKVDAVDKPNEICISVIDNGIGMTQEQASRLFQKNIHRSTAGTDNETGTGLGLRIVKDFVDLLNAKIQVESQPGKGSVFALSFRKKDFE